MKVFEIILTILFIIAEFILIIAVLLQPSKKAGLSGPIAGGAETFFGKNKAKSYEGKLQLLTKISATTFIVLAIILSFIK